MNQVKAIFKLILSLVMVMLLYACNKDEEVVTPADETATDTTTATTEDDTTSSTTSIVNNWIYDVMSSYYYWNESVVAPDSSDTDPESYFYSLINENDAFSYITDDYEALAAEFSGVYTSMGYSPAFGLFSGTSDVFIIVEYVYPDSPAESAGLERGDIIIEIDGQTLTTDNYYDLYSQSSYSVTLGDYDADESAISSTSETLSLTSAVITTDPVLYKEVKEINGTKVGYLVYAEFISGESDEWLNSLGSAIDEFTAEGATELILDLRYNPGGEIYAAQYLASALAPSSAVTNSDVLVQYEYNDLLESYFEYYEGTDSEDLITTFESNTHHINLSQVYFLTGSGTASASELLINGLKPYMGVVSIGETTVGKCYGSWVIPDTETPARHDWAMMPIVLKYANADGLTDFTDGLTPDYEVDDNLLEAVPFGDETDPLLATAINLISGTPNARMNYQGVKPYENLQNPGDKLKNNLPLKISKDIASQADNLLTRLQ